ncbi:MAG: orotate phosphoribosyltransferase [Clostridia bacterium]|nr:orotate phosphoribosyltransferase [Clostridia bacterium]
MKREIAADLLKIKAVFLRPDAPFTWASGIKAPIYCDNRLTLSDIAVRTDVENALAELIRRHYPDCQAVMGTNTAGIAHAAIVATILELPMGYVRATAKDHGRTNQIEGRCDPGTKVVVVEDLISTAGSVVDVCEALRAAGAEVLGIVSIFTYGMQKAADRLAEHNLVNVSASDYDTLLTVAAGAGYIRAEQIPALLAFRDNPADESWISLN